MQNAKDRKIVRTNEDRSKTNATVQQRVELADLVKRFTELALRTRLEMESKNLDRVALSRVYSFNSADGRPIYWEVHLWRKLDNEPEARWVTYFLTRGFKTTHIFYAVNAENLSEVTERPPADIIKFLDWMNKKLSNSWRDYKLQTEVKSN